MGDVSAHSSAWGSRVTYARGVKNGNVILNFVMEHNLTILKNGMAFRFTRAGYIAFLISKYFKTVLIVIIFPFHVMWVHNPENTTSRKPIGTNSTCRSQRG